MGELNAVVVLGPYRLNHGFSRILQISRIFGDLCVSNLLCWALRSLFVDACKFHGVAS